MSLIPINAAIKEAEAGDEAGDAGGVHWGSWCRQDGERNHGEVAPDGGNWEHHCTELHLHSHNAPGEENLHVLTLIPFKKSEEKNVKMMWATKPFSLWYQISVLFFQFFYIDDKTPSNTLLKQAKLEIMPFIWPVFYVEMQSGLLFWKTVMWITCSWG